MKKLPAIQCYGELPVKSFLNHWLCWWTFKVHWSHSGNTICNRFSWQTLNGLLKDRIFTRQNGVTFKNTTFLQFLIIVYLLSKLHCSEWWKKNFYVNWKNTLWKHLNFHSFFCFNKIKLNYYSWYTQLWLLNNRLNNWRGYLICVVDWNSFCVESTKNTATLGSQRCKIKW